MTDDYQSKPPSFNQVQETEEDLCRAMWLAVLVQTVLDANGKSGTRLDQAKARKWLSGRGGFTSDFAAVCDLAGVDFETTRKRFSSLLDGKGEGIDFRCMKKANPKNRSQESRRRYFKRADKNARARLARQRSLLFADMVSGNCSCDNDNFINQQKEVI